MYPVLVHTPEKAIGFILAQFGTDEAGNPVLISNRLYLAQGYQSEAGIANVWKEIERFAAEIGLKKIAQASSGAALSQEPPEEYEEKDLTLVRLQTLKGDIYNDHVFVPEEVRTFSAFAKDVLKRVQNLEAPKKSDLGSASSLDRQP